jgi:hypothetical protein
MNDNYCFTASEIGRYIGYGARSVPKLVKSANLPAYRRVEMGNWLAKKVDLDLWMDDQKDKYLSKD